MSDPTPTKVIRRALELELGVQYKGENATKLMDGLIGIVQRWQRMNPGRPMEDVVRVVRRLGQEVKQTDPLFLKLINDQQKAGNAATRWANLTVAATASVQKAMHSVLSPINAVAGAVGGIGIGFNNSLNWITKYNKQLIGLSGQMSKYGVGITQVEGALENMRNQTGLTKEESSDLFSMYEKGFPYNSLENGAKLFNNIKNAVGGNSDAMKDMMGMLQGMIDKFPELEDAITNVNEGGNRKMLESQSRLAYMTGQLSLAEHKRFQDYIRGGRQVKSEDDRRRAQVQEQIDAINRLRASFEEVAEEIGKILIEYAKPLANWIKSILPVVKPWIPTILGVVGGFMALNVAARAFATTMKTIEFFGGGGKLLNGLKGGAGAFRNLLALGRGGGGAGGWGAKSVGMLARSPGALAQFGMRAAGGAGVGYMVGEGVDAGYQALTGKELDRDYGGRAVAGQMGKAGSMIAAGAAVGGIPGAIGAGIVYDVKGIYEIGKVSLEIKRIWGDIGEANKKIEAGWDNIVSIAQQKKQAAVASGNEREIVRADRNVQIQEMRARAEKLQQEGTGMLWNDDGKLEEARTLRKQADDLQKQNNQDRESEQTDNVKAVLSKYKIDINEEQLKQINNMLGSGDVGTFGVTGDLAKNQGQIIQQGKGDQFEQLIGILARQATGKANAIDSSKTNPTAALRPADNTSGIDSAASNVTNMIGNNDLAGAARAQQSMMNLMDNTNVQNTLGGASEDVKSTLQSLGVNSGQIAASGFKMSDSAWGDLTAAQSKAQTEMSSLQEKQSGGAELSDDEKKRLETLKQTNAVINAQLEERYKIQDRFGPQLQLIDAAFNEHSKAVEATNKLLQSQKSLLSAMVSNAQVTGRFDMSKISGQTQEALRSLQQYNEGLRQQTALEIQQLQLAEQEMAMAKRQNQEDIARLQSTTNADGSTKSAAQQKEDKKKSDALILQNKQLEIRQQRNVLEQSAQAKINEQLEQTETMQKQIVEILQSRLELNKANVEYAAANVSKAEALIDIYDNMGAGLKASAQMRMDAANLMGRQIEEEKRNLEVINATIQEGVPAMAEEVGKEKEFQGKSKEEIMAEAKKRLIALDTQRVQKETTILGLVSKQAQMTKAMREGYVSAIMAMTAGSGMFNKILITQDKNMGMGVKYMNVLQGKTSGGVGGGKTEAGQFTTSGLNPGSEEPGYKMWDGQQSNNNDVENIQRNALDYTRQRIADQRSGNAGAMGAPNMTGAVLQEAAAGENPLPPAQPGVNSPKVEVGPVTTPQPTPPGTNITGPAVAAQPENTTLMQTLVSTATTAVDILRQILTKITPAGTAPMTPTPRGGVTPFRGYREGGLVGLYRDGGGVSGLTKGESERGDQYQIAVAGGEVIMNQRQWPRVAAALGMSPAEFTAMVNSKDYSRLPSARYADGGQVAGGTAVSAPATATVVAPASPDTLASIDGKLTHTNEFLEKIAKGSPLAVAPNTAQGAAEIQAPIAKDQPLARGSTSKPANVVPPADAAREIVMGIADTIVGGFEQVKKTAGDILEHIGFGGQDVPPAAPPAAERQEESAPEKKEEEPSGTDRRDRHAKKKPPVRKKAKPTKPGVPAAKKPPTEGGTINGVPVSEMRKQWDAGSSEASINGVPVSEMRKKWKPEGEGSINGVPIAQLREEMNRNKAESGTATATLSDGSTVSKRYSGERILPSSEARATPGNSQPAAQPQSATVNLGGITVNYGELSKMVAAAKEQIDKAMDEAAKQMSGGRSSSLPRSTT